MTALEGQPAEFAQYLVQLTKALQPLPEAEREDILREVGSNLSDGLAAGESVEALLARLGPADAVGSALVEERLITVDRRRTPDELIRIVAEAAFRPFLGGIVGWLTIMELNTVYLYRDWMTEHQMTWRSLLELGMLASPAILVVCLPIATLFAGLLGVPQIARTLSRPTFRTLLPRLSAAILAFGLGVSAVAVALNDWVVIPANVATIRLQREIMGGGPWSEVLSPQEQTLSALAARIADQSRRHDRVGSTAGKADAWAQDIANLRFDYHLKLSLPLMAFSLSAVGLALGLLVARRRPSPWPVHAVLGLVVVMANYVVYALIRGMVHGGTFWTRWPALAAWLWDLSALGVAVLIGSIAWGRLRGADHA